VASKFFWNQHILSDNLQYQLIKYHNIPTGHFILHYPRYVKKLSFWKNCDSAEKGLKRALLKKLWWHPT